MKRVKFERSNISAAESVRNVEKHAIFFFRSKSIPLLLGTLRKKVVNIDKLEKVTFYDFGNKQVDMTEWKDGTSVLLNQGG
ncbi:MAG: hypothetical protein ACTSUQ_04070 [Candidatus Freyarchaeota archaeon]